MNLIIGQGAITVTPIQVANAYKTLLTSTSSSPYLNLEASDNFKLRKYNVSDEFIDFLKNDLNLVTNKNGTAYAAFEVMGRKANDIGGRQVLLKIQEKKIILHGLLVLTLLAILSMLLSP